MDCKKNKDRLSAYSDGEIKGAEGLEIAVHLKNCSECSAELVFITRQNDILTQLQPIEPSVNFKPLFWKKVEELNEREGLRWLSWITVPAFSLLVLVALLQFSFFSFTLRAEEHGNLRSRIVAQAIQCFIRPAYQFNVASLVSFCEKSCTILCECCRESGAISSCVCGNCSMNSLKKDFRNDEI